MNYIESLKQKKKKYLTKKEKKFLSEVHRFETLEKVYEHRIYFLKFNIDTHLHSKCLSQGDNFQKNLERYQEGLDYIRAKLNEFHQM